MRTAARLDILFTDLGLGLESSLEMRLASVGYILQLSHTITFEYINFIWHL